MSGPPGGLKASVEHMRVAAENWSNGAGRLDSAATASAGMDKTRLEFGIFQIVWTEYDSAAQYIQDRLREGSAEFESAAGALNKCADAYETTEGNFASNIKDLQVSGGQ